MTPASWREHGVGWMGKDRDYDKRYQKTHNGWLLIDEPAGGPTTEIRKHERWYVAEERRHQKRLKYFLAVNTDLRHTEEFRKLLCNLDEEFARRVAKEYIEFLYREIEQYSLPMACGDNILAHNNKTPVGSWHI